MDEQRFVRIGGIEQWISIRGEDTANPVMIEIHGGPGASHSVHAARTRAWEEHFTVVRWGMRGAGRTFGRSGARGQGEMSFQQLYEDALDVTRYARERLGADRVVLVASSLGSVFGLRLARSHPELYSAYVGSGSLWFSPLHSLREIGQYFAGMKFSARLTPALAAFDDRADGTRFELPFFVFQGDRDVITPAERARSFFDEVEAPVKEFALIEDVGHFAAFRHPDRFLHLLRTRVRPVVTDGSPSCRPGR
ncbi:alpha/beta fold hydrolase [Streptomyces vinaceus]|uniref:alpha/beta fold hydrolase n=1 Tax=Streptomyces vinaceus TaxID=1960 RepID=UPI003807EC28